MDILQFQEMVDEVVANLPDKFANALENVKIIAEVWPTAEDLRSVRVGHGTMLFGLYRGVPKTKRLHYNAVTPDKIIIFAGPIIRANRGNLEGVKRQVKSTVLHEIGHHLGMSEDQIRKAQNRG